jgi:hypothetical protein
MPGLNEYFETMMEIPRMKVGKRQTFETLISEETLLFAKYLRSEKKDWLPRITNIRLGKEDRTAFGKQIKAAKKNLVF